VNVEGNFGFIFGGIMIWCATRPKLFFNTL
jgi:hypothetical protein